MEIKLGSKLMKAINGLMLFAISIIVMACSYEKLLDIHWLIGLFLLLGGLAMGCACILEKKNRYLGAIACVYTLLAIIFFAKDTIVLDGYFFVLWIMVEGAILFLDGMKQKEAGANLSFVSVCGGALVMLLGFVSGFIAKGGRDVFVYALERFGAYGAQPDPKMTPLIGVCFLLIALIKIFPVFADCMPKCELKLKK